MFIVVSWKFVMQHVKFIHIFNYFVPFYSYKNHPNCLRCIDKFSLTDFKFHLCNTVTQMVKICKMNHKSSGHPIPFTYGYFTTVLLQIQDIYWHYSNNKMPSQVKRLLEGSRFVFPWNIMQPGQEAEQKQWFISGRTLCSFYY